MKKKIFLKIVIILSLIIITWFVYSKYFKIYKGKLSIQPDPTSEIEKENIYNSNIIKDINYTSRDLKGNEYTIFAKQGEIDHVESSFVPREEYDLYL